MEVAGITAHFGRRDVPLQRGEAVFLLLAAISTWLGAEYGEAGEVTPWFAQTIFGVPLQYLLFGLLVVAVGPYVMSKPRFALSFRLRELGLLQPLFAASIVLALSLAVAILRGVPELFADWRNLLVAAITAVLAAKWLAAQSWSRFAITDLATLYGFLAIPDLIAYAVGYGSTVLGVRTTVFEGTSLYLGAFAAIVAAWNLLYRDQHLSPLRTGLLRLAGVSGSLLVLLSFRRSFWLVWGVGLVAVLVLFLRSRNANPTRVLLTTIGGGALIIVAVAALGTETFLARLQSFLPTDTGEFSATNEDHINDLIDAWSIVQQDPILGFGIGRQYETNLISDWKTESFEVHNAVLHVWLKFGIAGAAVYIWFHFALARAASKDRYLAPVGAFVIGQFVATVFGTWPYGRFQMAIFLGLLIALVAVAQEPSRLPRRIDETRSPAELGSSR